MGVVDDEVQKIDKTTRWDGLVCLAFGWCVCWLFYRLLVVVTLWLIRKRSRPVCLVQE